MCCSPGCCCRAPISRLDLIGAPNWIIQALSIVVAAGLPVALIIAWAFELTPEGLKREKDVDRSQSITAQTGRKLDRVIIGVLTAGGGLPAGRQAGASGPGHRLRKPPRKPPRLDGPPC